jgi:hypothetical protein
MSVLFCILISVVSTSRYTKISDKSDDFAIEMTSTNPQEYSGYQADTDDDESRSNRSERGNVRTDIQRILRVSRENRETLKFHTYCFFAMYTFIFICFFIFFVNNFVIPYIN